MKDILVEFLRFLTNRVFILFVVISIMFFIALSRFFELQIVKGEYYQSMINTNITKKVVTKAPRGLILDRYGKSLATNKPIFTVTIDRSMFNGNGEPLIATLDTSKKQIKAPKDLNINDLNEVIFDFIKLLQKNNEQFIDTFMVSKTEPFYYLLDGNKEKELRYIQEYLGKDEDRGWISADEFIKELRSKKWFDIDESISNTDARDILSIRCELKINRFLLFQPFTLAKDVSFATVSEIEELNKIYYGLSVDTDSLREYDNGIVFSNLIGYTGKIGAEEFESLEGDGYNQSDIIGKIGLESTLEPYLRGVEGLRTVMVDNQNRKIATLDEVNPKPGNKVFLTIDKDLQIKVYNIIEQTLKDILLAKLRGNTKEQFYTEKDVLASMVFTNNVAVLQIFKSPENTHSFDIKNFILSKDSEIDVYTQEGFKKARTILSNAILDSEIRPTKILQVLSEQGILKETPEELSSVSPKSFIISKLEDNVLTPAIIGLEPYSASAVVLDTKTGETLAAVGYPNYDNNMFSNTIDGVYLTKLNSDKTSPFVNRPYSELLAPGSVFKMITAVTGLETDTITPTTEIVDKVVFMEAAFPYPTCTSNHGSVNVIEALEASCNYFFFETSYRMGSTKFGNKLDSINSLNKYMEQFGLNNKSGVEIAERQYGGKDGLHIASPELRKYIITGGGKKDVPANTYNWTDGNTVRTAIGQDDNAYSAAVMAKYISTIANRGVRYKSTLIRKIETPNNNLIKRSDPIVETEIALKDSTWDVLYEGMKRVVSGDHGTARVAFADFAIPVAGKTGTAEENESKSPHTTFGGYAPTDNPEIALYVIVPNGDTKGLVAASSTIARKIIEAYMGMDVLPQLPTDENTLLR